MDIVHRTPTREDIIADRVRFADSTLGKLRGLIARGGLDSREAFVMRFGDARPRRVHTLFIRDPIDVVWVAREEVTAVRTLRPWQFGSAAVADTVIELPEDTAADIEVGDVVRLASAGRD